MRDRSLQPEVQYGIDHYRVDFAFPAQRLVVEAHGWAWHDAVRDADRDAHLAVLGWMTLRFTGSEIFHDVAGVAARVATALEERMGTVAYSDLGPEPKRMWGAAWSTGCCAATVTTLPTRRRWLPGLLPSAEAPLASP